MGDTVRLVMGIAGCSAAVIGSASALALGAEGIDDAGAWILALCGAVLAAVAALAEDDRGGRVIGGRRS